MDYGKKKQNLSVGSSGSGSSVSIGGVASGPTKSSSGSLTKTAGLAGGGQGLTTTVNPLRADNTPVSNSSSISMGTASGVGRPLGLGGGSNGGVLRSTGNITNPKPDLAASAVDERPNPDNVAGREVASKAAKLKGDISSKRSLIEDAYNALFGDLTNLVGSRSQEVMDAAGRALGDLARQYSGTVPRIVSSFSAIGGGDSTDVRDAKLEAKRAYDESVSSTGRSRDADLAKIGQYAGQTQANWMGDKNSILRLLDSIGQTDDVAELNQANNDIANRLDQLAAERATLTTDEGARGKLASLTNDAGRYDSIKASLDNIMNSSLSGSIKKAAVQAIADSSDLSDEDKQKIMEQYGDIYNTDLEV